MAKRSRKNRQSIPGYDESRPNREERKQQHRRVRHAANQMLHMIDDPEEVGELPEVRGTRRRESPEVAESPGKHRFKLWKTKFWKRRHQYQDVKAEMDKAWPVITSEQLQHEQP